MTSLQSIGKVPVNVQQLGVDMLTIVSAVYCCALVPLAGAHANAHAWPMLHVKDATRASSIAPDNSPPANHSTDSWKKSSHIQLAYPPDRTQA